MAPSTSAVDERTLGSTNKDNYSNVRTLLFRRPTVYIHIYIYIYITEDFVSSGKNLKTFLF